MSVLIVDNETRYIDDLERFISPNVAKTVKWHQLQEVGTEGFDLIVLSGGHFYSVVGHEDLWEEEERVIRTTKTPILGICLGAQLIAHAFGSTIVKKEIRTKGSTEISVIRNDEIFGGLRRFEAYENHQWAISEVGPEMNVLARSEGGIEVIKHNERKIYGVQFHPEIDGDRNLSRSIFKVFGMEMN